MNAEVWRYTPPYSANIQGCGPENELMFFGFFCDGIERLSAKKDLCQVSMAEKS